MRTPWTVPAHRRTAPRAWRIAAAFGLLPPCCGSGGRRRRSGMDAVPLQPEDASGANTWVPAPPRPKRLMSTPLRQRRLERLGAVDERQAGEPVGLRVGDLLADVADAVGGRQRRD